MTTPVDHLRQYVDFTLWRYVQRDPPPDVHMWSRVFVSRFWDVVEDILPLPLEEHLREELRESLWTAPLFQMNWFPVSRLLRVDVPADIVAENRHLEWESPPTRLEAELFDRARRCLEMVGRCVVPDLIRTLLDDFESLSLIGSGLAAACVFGAVVACDSLEADDRRDADLLLAPARALIIEHYRQLDPKGRALFDRARRREEKLRRRNELDDEDWERSDEVVQAMVALAAFLWRRRGSRLVS